MSHHNVPFRDWNTHANSHTFIVLHSSADGLYLIYPISAEDNNVQTIGFRVASLKEGKSGDLGVFKTLTMAKQFVEKHDSVT
jgi:hypothetical protein